MWKPPCSRCSSSLLLQGPFQYVILFYYFAFQVLQKLNVVYSASPLRHLKDPVVCCRKPCRKCSQCSIYKNQHKQFDIVCRLYTFADIFMSLQLSNCSSRLFLSLQSHRRQQVIQPALVRHMSFYRGCCTNTMNCSGRHLQGKTHSTSIAHAIYQIICLSNPSASISPHLLVLRFPRSILFFVCLSCSNKKFIITHLLLEVLLAPLIHL